MRIFILLAFFALFMSLSIASKAYSSNYVLEFSSEKAIPANKNASGNDNDIKPKNAEPTTQKTAKKIKKEKQKITKQKRKEFRKSIWENLKEQRKINKKLRKENRKKGVKNQRIHWSAYVAIFAALIALAIIIAALFLAATYTIFNILAPLAFLLLPISIISGIIGVSVALKDNNDKFDKIYTLTLSLVGGILSLVTLLSLILLIVAISSAFM